LGHYDQIAAVLHCHELPEVDNSRLRFDELADCETEPGRRAFSDQQALISIASVVATIISNTPMAMLPRAS
jgi:hypothetical protein